MTIDPFRVKPVVSGAGIALSLWHFRVLAAG